MRKKSIKVTSPATVSNVGPGFDIFGFAVDVISDELIIRETDKKGVVIKKITGDKGVIPLDPTNNTAGYAIISLLKDLNCDKGFEIEIKKLTGLGGGLGSSAASAVAGAYAVNEMLGKPFKKDQLLKYALDGESIASKAMHADNVAPCLFGGFIIARGGDPMDIVKIKAPNNLYCTVCYPDIIVKTAEARKMLKKSISLKDGIKQWGNAAGMVAGLMKSDFDLISRSFEDLVSEPVRGKLIPGYDDIKNAALEKGALGCSVSGSGPSIFAFSGDEETACKISRAMKKAASKNNMKSKNYLSLINKTGVKAVS